VRLEAAEAAATASRWRTKAAAMHAELECKDEAAAALQDAAAEELGRREREVEGLKDELQNVKDALLVSQTFGGGAVREPGIRGLVMPHLQCPSPTPANSKRYRRLSARQHLLQQACVRQHQVQ